MKKHELLKYAYDNYPKGTKFQWHKNNTFCSNGIFEFPHAGEKHLYCNGQTLYDGFKWAEIVSDKQPLWIAEDDTEMFEDSECHWAYEHDGKWYYNNRIDFCKSHVDLVKSQPHIHRVFGTEENAHNWIEKQNKPKEIEVKLFNNKTAFITNELITIKYYSGTLYAEIFPSDIEDISNALKQLQS